VGNRAFTRYTTEATALVLEGASPEDIDKALYQFGWAMGPFQVADLSGNDIGYRHREDKGWIKDPSKRPKPYPFTVADRLVELGRLGQKTGAGWYDYEGRKNVPSQTVKALIEKVRKEEGIKPRKFSKEDIIERTMYAMVNEAFKILEEGIALRPSDVDVVFVFGYGFPAYRGGIMFWADLEGLPKVYQRLKALSQEYPYKPYFQVSALLEKLANEKTTLGAYWRKIEKKNAKL